MAAILTEVLFDAHDPAALAAFWCSVLGYEVTEAGDGASALAAWNEHAGRFDLLMTDMVLPGGLSGLQIASQLRALDERLRVIVSSGYSQELSQVGLGPTAGIVFLPKPYETLQLVRSVREILDGRHRQDPGAGSQV